MIDVNIFIVMVIIGGALIITGVASMNPKGIRANLSLIAVLIGAALFAGGLHICGNKLTKGMPIKFSELQDQKYISKKAPQNWRLIQIDSVHFQKGGWKVVKDFPATFNFSANKFTKCKEEATYPKKLHK